MNDSCSIPIQSEATMGTFDLGPGKHVLYFGDPMCSWCWGFAPELAQISVAVADQAQFHLVMGGLRPGTKEPWDSKMRGYIRHHWQEVATITGQSFDFSRFENEAFVYDTEPACRALATVRNLDPSRALSFYEALQYDFYAKGKDLCDPNVLASIAQTVGLDKTTFVAHFTSAEARSMASFDFSRTRAFGVTGFPSILCAEDGQYAFLSLGYRPYSAIAPLLQEWLNA